MSIGVCKYALSHRLLGCHCCTRTYCYSWKELGNISQWLYLFFTVWSMLNHSLYPFPSSAAPQFCYPVQHTVSTYTALSSLVQVKPLTLGNKRSMWFLSLSDQSQYLLLERTLYVYAVSGTKITFTMITVYNISLEIVFQLCPVAGHGYQIYAESVQILWSTTQSKQGVLSIGGPGPHATLEMPFPPLGEMLPSQQLCPEIFWGPESIHSLQKCLPDFRRP